jgi:hypothetical protein
LAESRSLAKRWEFANIYPKLTGYNTSGQSKALDSLWKALGFEGSQKPGEKPDGEDEQKSSFFRAFPEPQIYRASWLRKPGDPEFVVVAGETAGGGGGTSTLSEPVISDPEPPPRSAMPEVVP